MLPKLTIREKEICHISVESVMCKELEQQATDEYISILKTVTNFNITLNTLGSYILDCPINPLEETLLHLKHFGYKVAVIWAEGSWPVEPDIDEEILKSVDEWNNTRWGCAGHILDRNNNPQFHHQCVIINLAELENSLEMVKIKKITNEINTNVMESKKSTKIEKEKIYSDIILKLLKKIRSTDYFFFISPIHFKIKVYHQEIPFTVIFRFNGYKWIVQSIKIPFSELVDLQDLNFYK